MRKLLGNRENTWDVFIMVLVFIAQLEATMSNKQSMSLLAFSS